MPLSLGLRLGLSASTSTLGWVPTAESSPAAVAFNGQQFALPAYGSELVTNGTFDTDVIGWTAAGGTPLVTWSSGSIRVENGAAAESVARQFFSVTPGKLYRFTANSTGGTSTAFSVDNNSSAHTYIIPTTVASGLSIERYFVAVGPECRVFVRTNSAVLGIVAIADNVSVREVMLGEIGTNLGASGYTMSVNGGTGTATESPSGQLNLTGDGVNPATGDKQLTGLTVGAHYRIVCLVATNAISLLVGTTQGTGGTVPLTTFAAGVLVAEFTATVTTHWVRFSRGGASLCTISSITIAQWTPRPTLRTASFSEVFAFTGSSTTAKTYVGSDGLIKNDLAADVPRWDFSNGKARLLLENASTNLFTRSADFSDANWSKTGATVTDSATTAPDGTLTAEKIVESALNEQHRVQQNPTLTAAAHTMSVYAKAGERTIVELEMANGANGAYADFNLATGAILTAATTYGSGYSATSATITAIANGWYRVTLTATVPSGTNNCWIRMQTAGATATYAGNGVSGLFLWGAQLEAASFASSYIPTAGATVTRTIETARFSPLVEAIFQLPGATARAQGRHNALFSDGQIVGFNSTEWALGTNSSGTRLQAWDGANSLFAENSGTSTAVGFGGVWASNASGSQVAYNGVAGTANTSAVIGLFDRSSAFLSRTGGSVYGYVGGYYNSFALYPFRVSSANLAAIAVAPT